MSDRTDDVAARRARIKRLAVGAKRLGYLALLVSIVAFAVALVTSLHPVAVWTSVAGLVVACVVLPVPIVLGYGVRAAEREEHQQARDVG